MKEVPLRRVARVVNGGTPTPDPDNWDGNVPWATPVDLGRSHGQSIEETARSLSRTGLQTGSAEVPMGSVILSTRAPVGYVARNSVPMAFNQGCKGIVPAKELDAGFLSYVLQSRREFLEAVSTGTTFLELSTGSLLGAPIPLPTLDQQRAIADFLDRETAQIDAMIEAQERVVARLTERRSSTITALVTGHALGLPLTASGNPLLGEVPEGWEVGRFGRHTRINGGQVDPGTEPWNEMILVAPNHVESGTGRLLALETAAEQGADSGKYLVRKGQIIYSKIRPSLNKVTIAPQDVLCSADMYGITCLGEGDHRYFANFMLATPFHQYATMVSDRVKMPKINREELSAAPWLVPPMAEQTRIADLVDATTRELDTAISETRTLSALLHERRAALIAAAVTGRIDPTTGIEQIAPTTKKEAS